MQLRRDRMACRAVQGRPARSNLNVTPTHNANSIACNRAPACSHECALSIACTSDAAALSRHIVKERVARLRRLLLGNPKSGRMAAWGGSRPRMLVWYVYHQSESETKDACSVPLSDKSKRRCVLQLPLWSRVRHQEVSRSVCCCILTRLGSSSPP